MLTQVLTQKTVVGTVLHLGKVRMQTDVFNSEHCMGDYHKKRQTCVHMSIELSKGGDKGKKLFANLMRKIVILKGT